MDVAFFSLSVHARRLRGSSESLFLSLFWFFACGVGREEDFVEYLS